MPIPIILGIGAGIAALTGVGTGIRGAVKMKDANDTMKSADSRHKRNLEKFEEQKEATSKTMDELGKEELKILESFSKFTEVYEKIKNKPQFEMYDKDGVSLPQYSADELKKVSIGAGVLLGGIGGAALGTAGGFAAAGAATAAVMALGTASTGTAIASLSGVAATNATLAALGGGAIAAGGGGMALGTTLLGAATLGVGLLVGGVIFNVTGSSLSNKADEAWSQMQKAEDEILKICNYLIDLNTTANTYLKTILNVSSIYFSHLNNLTHIVEVYKKDDWNNFTEEEKLSTENTVLLVQLLYNMCKVQIVLASESSTETNKINKKDVETSIQNADHVLKAKGLAS